MSVIQKIRDKYARIAVIAIAVSLLGFILMDAFAGKTGLFSNSQSTTLGKVNGETINAQDFAKKLKEEEDAERAQAQAQGYPYNEDRNQQLVQVIWDQEVSDIVMKEEYNMLGLTVTDRELRDMLYGANPPADLKQRFTDPKTGQFDAAAAQQAVNQAIKDPTQKGQIQKYFDYLKNQRLMSKYTALLTNTIYFPKWFLEKQNIDNSLMAKISYITVPYSSVADSAVKVSDEEIKKYINEHKNDFQQKEETRSISYVLFSAAPSSADSAATKSEVEKLKAQFTTTKDPGTFVQQQGSSINYYDAYLPKSSIQVPAKDSIFALQKGGVYGPYLDGDSYVLAKLIDVKTMPDSAKAKHILIATNNPQTGQVLLADSIAKKRIDSIKLAIDRGASFDLLAKKFSADKGSAEKGGLVTNGTNDYFPQGAMVKEFNDSVFNGKIGEKLIVKTVFGYHLIQILDLKNIEPHYKIAYFAKQIIPSRETEDNASNDASAFAGNSQNLKAFNENADKLKTKGINKLVATDLHAMDYNVQGLQGNGRAFIKKVFDANNGDVIGPESVGDNYVVAIVTEINKPGLESVSKVRPMIEPMLRNRKKGELILKNIGQVTSLESAAAKMKQTVQTADSIHFNGGQTFGYEPKILGAIFNTANKGKTTPAIAGQAGVYVVRVENVTTIPVETASIEDQRKMLESSARQSLMSQMQQGANPIIDMLKKTATIKDYRAKFY